MVLQIKKSLFFRDVNAKSDVWALGRAAFQSTPPCGGRRLILPAIVTVTRCFNPRPRAGGDVPSLLSPDEGVLFQSTPPCGGRPDTKITSLPNNLFQSTPPCGGRQNTPITKLPDNLFQSTPPCGGRRAARASLDSIRSFQSTPPCGGRLPSSPTIPTKLTVSIHAPVRGATCRSSARRRNCARFNPRPRAGGDCSLAL